MSRLDRRKNDLSPRAPPFAADLNAVIEFYDTRFGIESVRGLVENEHFRIMHQCSSDSNSLLHAMT